MSRKLKDIDIREISLVDAAANRLKFFIRKRSESPMHKIIELFKALVGKFTDAEAEVEKSARVPEADRPGLESALQTLVDYKADFPDDVLAAVTTVAKCAAGAILPLPEVDLATLPIEKIGARLSKSTEEELGKIVDALKIAASKVKALIGKSADAEKSKYDGLPEDVRKRLERLDALDEERAAAVAKAASDEKATLLKTIANLTERLEAVEKTRTVSKAAKTGGDGDDDEEKPDETPVEKGGKKVFLWKSILGNANRGE